MPPIGFVFNNNNNSSSNCSVTGTTLCTQTPVVAIQMKPLDSGGAGGSGVGSVTASGGLSSAGASSTSNPKKQHDSFINIGIESLKIQGIIFIWQDIIIIIIKNLFSKYQFIFF